MSQEEAAAGFRKLEMLQEERGADRKERKGALEAEEGGGCVCAGVLLRPSETS